MEKIILDDGNNKILSKSILKGKSLNTDFNHPAYTRYPHLKPQPTDAQYTDWKKWFAWKPVRLLSGKRVWLQTIYKRERTVQWVPPAFPEGSFDRIEYSTWEDIMENKFK